MRHVLRLLSLALVPLAALLALEEEPVPLAGDGGVAVLRFEIRERGGGLVPGRLTFLGEGGPRAELFPRVEAAPPTWAVRRNVVYALEGAGALTVPPGRYRLYASRGLEWSLDETVLELEAGAEARWTAELVHEVDTRGWISGDFHLHTLTHSGHGDASLEERIVSLVGEGVEFAVATDHNHNTDYAPTIAGLGAGAHLGAVTGNEVSVPVGHFNAFPLDPARAPLPKDFRDANELFRLLRGEQNPQGIVPVIQLNHPRWDGIDYFAQAGLDPVTATSTLATYSADFDSLEVLNENVGWGYYDPATDGVPTGSNLHSVLDDWFGLLNRGLRYAAVGNSDSHTVHSTFAGYPRNFVRSTTDDPAAVSPAEVAAAIRARSLFTTLGPFLDVAVDGVGMGGEVTARGGRVAVRLRIQAASWVACDRVRLVWNGDVVRTLPVPAGTGPLRLDVEETLEVDRDGWLVVLAEGDAPLAPLVLGDESLGREARPLAVGNPVWIEGDGDGAWTSPRERARSCLQALLAGELAPAFQAEPPSARAAWLLAAGEELGRTSAAGSSAEELRLALAILGLRDTARGVRLAAARLAERLAGPALLPELEERLRHDDVDAYLGLALARAKHAAAPAGAELLLAYHERFGGQAVRRYSREIEAVAPGRRVEDFLVLGPFAAAGGQAAAEAGAPQGLGPGAAAALDPSATFRGKDGAELRWRPLAAEKQGYLDLLRAAPEPGAAEGAVVLAQTWLHVAEARRVLCAWGSDDGGRVWVGGELVDEHRGARSANPWEHLEAIDLAAGWNRVLFEVENGTGDFGLYFRVLAPEVEAAAAPR